MNWGGARAQKARPRLARQNTSTTMTLLLSFIVRTVPYHIRRSTNANFFDAFMSIM